MKQSRIPLRCSQLATNVDEGQIKKARQIAEIDRSHVLASVYENVRRDASVARWEELNALAKKEKTTTAKQEYRTGL